MKQWDKSFYISSVAGSNNGSSIVVMSKGIYTFLLVYSDHIFISVFCKLS
jgi:hypothetical protein